LGWKLAKEKKTSKSGAQWWDPLWELFVHYLIGAIIFLLIAFIAIGLNRVVEWLTESNTNPAYIVAGIDFTEKFLFYADVTLFIVFVIINGMRTIRKM
jgi:hypothetical protein